MFHVRNGVEGRELGEDDGLAGYEVAGEGDGAVILDGETWGDNVAVETVGGTFWVNAWVWKGWRRQAESWEETVDLTGCCSV